MDVPHDYGTASTPRCHGYKRWDAAAAFQNNAFLTFPTSTSYSWWRFTTQTLFFVARSVKQPKKSLTPFLCQDFIFFPSLNVYDSAKPCDVLFRQRLAPVFLIAPYYLVLCPFLWGCCRVTQAKKLSCERNCHSLTKLVLRKFSLQINPHFSSYFQPFTCRARLLLQY